MKNKCNYFLRDSKKLILFFTCLDLIHRFIVFCFFWRVKKSPHFPPQRILLANCGGLGDVVLCSGVVAEIKRRFPNCKIGFIVLKQSKIALETLPHIDWIHEDTFRIVPGQTRLHQIIELLKCIFLEHPKLAKQIKNVGYDCAIELRPFFPNLIPLFWKSKIPLRIGFTSGGNSKLLNAPVPWAKNQYLPHCYWDLLAKLRITKGESDSLMQTMVLKETPLFSMQKPYIIFHLCSSAEQKDFSFEFWRILYKKCKEREAFIYFTGKGDRDQRIIQQVIDDEQYNLCNKLSWTEFVQCIQQSRGIVSVDSAPVHLAASFNVPCALLFKNTKFPEIWMPNIPTCSAFGIHCPIELEKVEELVHDMIKGAL